MYEFCVKYETIEAEVESFGALFLTVPWATHRSVSNAVCGLLCIQQNVAESGSNNNEPRIATKEILTYAVKS